MAALASGERNFRLAQRMKRDAPAVRMLDHAVDGKKAWVRADLRAEDWLFRLPPECLSELHAAATQLRKHPLPLDALDPGQFSLPACRDLMLRVRGVLDDGARFAIVDRLPVDELGAAEAKSLYWLLSRMVARPVEQKLTGTMIYDVRDTMRDSSQ